MIGLVIPAAIGGLLTGAALFGPGRKGLTMLPKSPIRGVVLVRWTHFVRTMARHEPRYVSPRGKFGMFGMDMRRLSDVGFVQDARKGNRGTEPGVWVGEWKSPLTEDIYVASPAVQYESFKRSMVAMVPVAEQFVGATVDGSVCTLSGLLGVGHHAGESGIESWVKNKEVRNKFKNTTDTFKLANGIF
jgi:hypothetical protein